MKANKLVIALLTLLLCFMAGQALAVQFTIDEYGVITAISADSDIETLIIPEKVKNTETNDNVPVSKITANLGEFSNLKYILFKASKLESIPKVDLSTVANLECAYFAMEITDSKLSQIKQKTGLIDDDKILIWADLSEKSISNISGKFDNGKVTISFDNIVPDGYSGYGYKVLRVLNDDSSSETAYSFEDDVSHFSQSNGTVVFTDYIEQTGSQQNYCYYITAYCPFGSSAAAQEPVRITVPAKTTPTPAPNDPTPVPDDPIPVPNDPTPGPDDSKQDSLPATGDNTSPVFCTALIAMSIITVMKLFKRKDA